MSRVDYRYFELHDLLCEALIALEADDRGGAAATLRKALNEVELDWLATPTPLAPGAVTGSPPAFDDTDDD